MQANWSLVLNVLLLIGVVIAIGRMLKARRQSANAVIFQPSIGQPAGPSFDDIIAVRKVSREESQSIAQQAPAIRPVARPVVQQTMKPVKEEVPPVVLEEAPTETPASLVMFLKARENRQLAGYELLQTVLAAGLRFGEGHLFHRHQSPNGQGPVMCSLAAATPSGVFDLQNIGAFSVNGLCLFMETSGNSTIDAERFAIMLDTAKQLSEGLDTALLDDHQLPLTDAGVQRYYQKLNIAH